MCSNSSSSVMSSATKMYTCTTDNRKGQKTATHKTKMTLSFTPPLYKNYGKVGVRKGMKGEGKGRRKEVGDLEREGVEGRCRRREGAFLTHILLGLLCIHP